MNLKKFFNQVSFEDEQLQTNILEWILRLESEKIFIKNFSFLFSKYEEIIFPIKVSGVSGNLLIEDAKENQYNFLYNPYANVTKYIIGKKSANFKTEFTYVFIEKSKIFIKELSIVKFNGITALTNTTIKFCYLMNSITHVVLETKVNNDIIVLEINYEPASVAQDLEVANYLFDLAGKSKYISNTCFVSEKLPEKLAEILSSKEVISIYHSIKTDITPKKV